MNDYYNKQMTIQPQCVMRPPTWPPTGVLHTQLNGKAGGSGFSILLVCWLLKGYRRGTNKDGSDDILQGIVSTLSHRSFFYPKIELSINTRHINKISRHTIHSCATGNGAMDDGGRVPSRPGDIRGGGLPRQ